MFASFHSSVYPEAFSSCSEDDLGTFLQNSNPSCLLNAPHTDRLYGGPVCGNAFLEAGEECDCGTVEVRDALSSERLGLDQRHLTSSSREPESDERRMWTSSRQY